MELRIRFFFFAMCGKDHQQLKPFTTQVVEIFRDNHPLNLVQRVLNGFEIFATAVMQ